MPAATPLPDVALALDRITCTFAARGDAAGSYTAVKDTSLSVAAGEFVSVVGPTGCGKSTLLNVAAGLLAPSGGNVLIHGKPLFGKSKTVRGIVVSILFSAMVAPLLGLGWKIGVAVGGAAMAGDLVSSFVKRRLNLTPSSRATGLDQIPESLFPLLACRGALSLSILDIGIGVAIFFVGEVVLSLLLYKVHIRDRPY